MKSLCLLLFLALPLTACVEKPVQDPMTLEAQTLPVTLMTHEQSFAEFVAAKNVDPCPRFTSSLDAAERAVDDAPRDYPHML